MAIIIPEVFAQMVTEKVKGIVKISKSAVDLGVLGDFSQEGDSISFPQFCALSDAELLVKGSDITTEELKQTSTKKSVKHYSKGVSVYDVDAKEGKGNFIENAIMQQARIFAKARDNEMVADIDANAILKVPVSFSDKLKEDELMSAFQLWGDDQDNESIEGIYINSRLAPSFYEMEGFVNSNKTYTKEGNGEVVNGCIGYYRGTIPVILTDVNTYDESAKECKSYIIKKGALGKKDKTNGVNIELDRVAKQKRTDIYADEMFVCGLIQKDGVVILRKTIS